MKRSIKLLLSLLIVFSMGACTSKNDQAKSDENLDLESLENLDSGEARSETTESGETSSEPIAAAPLEGSDPLSMDPLADDPLAADINATKSDSNAASEPAAPPSEPVAPPAIAAIDTPSEAEAPDKSSAAPTDYSSSWNDSSNNTSTESGSAAVESSESPSKPSPLRKVDAVPRMVAGKALNSVYVARQGDTLSSISKKIYGKVRSSDFKKWNTYLKSRSVKTGDKLYYNSPNRPDDTNAVLTYYEDNGIQPQIYTAQAGADLKSVAKELLGSKDSWKELWSTNVFESKSSLDEGTQIRYWPTSAAGDLSNAVAGEPAAPPSKNNSELPTPTMPEADLAANGSQMPPPPNLNDAPPGSAEALPESTASNDLPPPPPPPETELPPPPPPPPSQELANNKNPVDNDDAGPTEAMDENMMFLGLGVIGIGAIAAIIVRNRKRKAEQEQFINETQVG